MPTKYPRASYSAARASALKALRPAHRKPRAESLEPNGPSGSAPGEYTDALLELQLQRFAGNLRLDEDREQLAVELPALRLLSRMSSAFSCGTAFL